MSMEPSSIADETDSFTDRPFASALSGFFYATFVISISIAMLLVNALLCLTIYSAIPDYGPGELSARVGQFFYFVAPVVLMVLEWHLIDRVRRMFSTHD